MTKSYLKSFLLSQWKIVTIIVLCVVIIYALNMGWCYIPSKHYAQNNKVIEILCTGLLGGLLTFIITVSIPEWEKNKRCEMVKLRWLEKSFKDGPQRMRSLLTESESAEFNKESLLASVKKNPLYPRNHGNITINRAVQLRQLAIAYRNNLFEYVQFWQMYSSEEMMSLISDIYFSDFFYFINEAFAFVDVKKDEKDDNIFRGEYLEMNFTVSSVQYWNTIEALIEAFFDFYLTAEKLSRLYSK